jgi:hypothetical protein
MGVSFVISGLVSKRSELAGLAEHYAQELDRLDADLKHLDATIKLFDPEIDLRTLPPKRFREANRIFRQGESNRLILEVMREAGGTLNTLAIAQRVAAKKHLDESLVKTVRDTVLDALRRIEKKGVVRQIGREGMALLWQLI